MKKVSCSLARLRRKPGLPHETATQQQDGATYPWLTRSTAMVNNFYIYCVDRDFGPFFMKFMGRPHHGIVAG